MGQADGQRHQLWGFVAGVAKHDPLIARADSIERIAVMVIGFVDSLGDIGGLLIEGDQYGTTVGIKATSSSAAIPDRFDHPTHQAVEIDPGRGGHLAGDQAEARVDNGFAGHAAGRILGQQGIEHGITDLITDLVRMPLGNRFRREDVTAHPGMRQQLECKEPIPCCGRASGCWSLACSAPFLRRSIPSAVGSDQRVRLGC